MNGATERQFGDRSVPDVNKCSTNVINTVNILKGWQFNPTGTEQQQRITQQIIVENIN